jgi:hypothetical protein
MPNDLRIIGLNAIPEAGVSIIFGIHQKHQQQHPKQKTVCLDALMTMFWSVSSRATWALHRK